MAEHQGPRRRAACQIIVNGQEITSRLHPYLISVQIIDTLEGGHDECVVELDDRNAELQLPPDGVTMQVALGWANEGPRLPDRGRRSIVGGQGSIPISPEELEQEQPWGGPGMELLFAGVVSEVESGFGRRSGGRRVWITATSGNVMGMAKQAKEGSWGAGKPTDSSDSGKEGSGGAGAGSGGDAGGGGGGGAGQISLNTVLSEAFAGSGIKVKLSPQMMNIKRDFWHMNQSPADFGMKIAREVGGVFKIAGGVATVIGKNEGVNADGQEMPTIDAVWGINLIGWRIKPYAGRPQYGSAQARFFNIHDAEWLTSKLGIGAGPGEGGAPFGGTQAIAHYLNPVADSGVAKQANTGSGEDSKSRRGTGWVLLNGEPLAKANGRIIIRDARPGVDGTYLMTEVEHNYTRGVGYTTRANVQYPSPKADGVGWGRKDPGKFDPYAKKPDVPAPTPPISGPTVFTEEELDRMRQWYLDNGQPIPEALLQTTNPNGLGYVARPPISGNQTWTPEELERMRAITEGRQPAAPPMDESYVPGQGGEGGITFPE